MNERLSRFNTGLLADRKITQLMIFTTLIFFFFSYASRDIFFSSSNFISMAYQIPEIAILSIALMLSMLTGGIDLSIVSISNAAALVASWVMTTKMGESENLSTRFGLARKPAHLPFTP